MGEQPLLRGRQGAQQERQDNRGGQLWASRQRLRSFPEQRATTVAGERERRHDVAARGAADTTGSLRAAEVDGAAAVVGHRVHRQRHHVRQLRPIIPRPCEMPSLYLHAMGRTLKGGGVRPVACRESKTFGHARRDDRYLYRDRVQGRTTYELLSNEGRDYLEIYIFGRF